MVAAARLCDRAQPGQILATDAVAVLAAGRLEHPLQPLGTLDLKGLIDPVAVCAITPASSAAGRTHAIDSVRPDRLVGRDSELSKIVEAWERCADGARLVVVHGEAGLGKSALVATAAAELRDRGAAVLYGAADVGPHRPFEPFPTALGSLLDDLPTGILAGTVRDDGAVLGHLVPDIAARLGVDPSGATDWADHLSILSGALGRVLRRAARAEPAVLVLDDMHAASADAARLLPALVEALADAPVLVVVAYRDVGATAGLPLVDPLTRASSAVPTTDLALEPLEADDLGTLLAGAVEADEIATIAERSGGNPFLVLTLVGHGVASDELAPAELLAARLDQLGDPAQEVIGAMALIGGEIDTSLLLEVLDLPEREVIDVIDRALATAILRETTSPSAVRFSHALVAEAAAGRLRGPRRSRLHVRIADATEAVGGSTAMVAHHLLEADSARLFERTLRASGAAAAEALDAFAHDDAREVLEGALDFAERQGRGEDPLVAPLLSDLAYALYQRGDLEGRRRVGHQLFSLANDLGDGEMLRHAARAIAGFPKAGEPDEQAERSLLVAIDATPPERPAARAELLSMLAYYRAINEGKGMEADELAQEAVSVARLANEPFELAEALASRSFVMTGAPPLGEHLEVLTELEGLLDSLPSAADRDRHEQYVLRQRAPVHFRRGDREAFDEDREALRRIADERQSWLAEATVAMWDGMISLFAGSYDEAEAHYGRMAEVGAREPNFANSLVAALFQVRHAQGRAAELREVAEATVAAAPGLVAFRPALARIQLADDDEVAAEATFRQLATGGFTAIPQDVTESFSLHHLIDLCVRFGSADDHTLLRRRLARFGGQYLVAAWGICALEPADAGLARLAESAGNTDEAKELSAAAAALEGTITIG